MDKILAKVQSEDGFQDEDERLKVYRELLKPVLRAFGDDLEKCRDTAVQIVDAMVQHLGDDTLEGIMQVVVTRVGIEPIPEDSEDVRLLLVKLATKIAVAHPHDVGPRNLLDYYKMILTQCLKDPFPDVKKECSACIAAICHAAPRAVPHISKVLLESVKPHMQHKHAAVRRQMVKAFSQLIMHGGQEILGDDRDNMDQHTTVYLLGMVISDQNDGVRFELLTAFQWWLTAMVERLDHHFRLLPMILPCTSDPHPKVRALACDILAEVGRYHMLDNEDLSIITTIDSRHVSLKDITWYCDDAYPDMSLISVPSTLPQPPHGVEHRPSLGTRMAVADAMRRWLPDVLKKLSDVEWSIPLSKMTRRHVALRCLQATIRYTENNCVQHLQAMLDALYKCAMDDDKVLQQEVLYTIELLGRFITPDHYVPLIMPSAYEGQTKEASSAAVLIAGGEDTNKRFPTWFSASNSYTRTCIIIVFNHLLKGATRELSVEQISCVLKACVNEDLMDYDNPKLLVGVLNIVYTVMRICEERGLLSDANKFDFHIFCDFLMIASAPDSAIVIQAQAHIMELSQKVTGTDTGIYDKHFAAILDSLGTTFSTPIFENLLTHAGTTQSQYTDKIVNMFCTRLADIQYTVDTNSNLKLFTVLNAFILNADTNNITFTSQQLEMLLRTVILPHSNWWKGQCALQFRRAASGCLFAVVTRQSLRTKLFVRPDSEPGLLGNLLDTVIGCYDTDDPDIRYCVVRLAPYCVQLPITGEHTKELMTELLSKFDDARDTIRIGAAHAVHAVYKYLLDGSVKEDCVKDALANKANLAEWSKIQLIHMDDTNTELQEAVYEALAEMAKVYKEVVQDETAKVRSKHHTFHYCDKLLAL